MNSKAVLMRRLVILGIVGLAFLAGGIATSLLFVGLGFRGERSGIVPKVHAQGGSGTDVAASDHVNRQLAELYQLQAAFHRAATIHDPVNGDSTEVINQRIRDMLSLWTDDGSLTLEVGGARDGNYVGQGDPQDLSTCPAPSPDPENRGTLCTFFKYVAGSFQSANKFVSLAPAYKTQFEIQGHTAIVYFECHYFNVATDAGTGQPLWTAASHVVFDGSASKVDGRWLFSHADAPVAGIPIP